MKTENNKLKFSKTSIVSLNDKDLSNIHGGSTNFFVDWIQDKIDDAKEQMSPWI